ncbi:hypothetical protein B0X78_03395 [bacterium AM6]|nr:hypothetical protein B0X78_03395 [bacterium AM6]
MRDATVDIYGFDRNSPQIDTFKTMINEEAGYEVPVKCLEFVDSRRQMLSVVKNASLVLMPSVHEGFGLVAWEAMCCCVPLIVAENSGFYRFVQESGQISNLESLSFHGHTSEAAVQEQIAAFSRMIRSLVEHPEEAHARAVRLLAGVRERGAVEASHLDFLKACGHVEGGGTSAATQPAPQPQHLKTTLSVQVDIGLDSNDQVEYRCNTSSHGIRNALLALRSGAGNVDFASYPRIWTAFRRWPRRIPTRICGTMPRFASGQISRKLKEQASFLNTRLAFLHPRNSPSLDSFLKTIGRMHSSSWWRASI